MGRPVDQQVQVDRTESTLHSIKFSMDLIGEILSCGRGGAMGSGESSTRSLMRFKRTPRAAGRGIERTRGRGHHRAACDEAYSV